MGNGIGLRVAVIVGLAAGAIACSGDDKDTLSVKLKGEGRQGLPSKIEWSVDLTREASVVGVEDGTVIAADEISERLWGFQDFRGGQLFEIDPTETPWNRGPLVDIVSGRILLGERRTDEPGDRWLVAFDVKTGGELWSVRLDFSDARPIVVGDNIIVATRDNSAAGLAGQVRLISLKDGSEIWSVPLTLAPDEDPNSGSYDDDAPLLLLDGNTLAVRTGTGSSVTLIDLADGGVIWTYDAPAPVRDARPVERFGLVLVTQGESPDASLVAVRIKTGETAWNADTTYGDAPLVGSATAVFYNDGGKYDSVDIQTGSLVWHDVNPGGTIVAESPGLFLFDSFAAVRRGDGQLAWIHSGTDAQDIEVAGDVFVVRDHNKVMVFALETGDPLWETDDPTVVIVSNELGAILTERSGAATMRDLHSGAVLWELDVDNGSNVAAVTDESGALYLSVSDDEKSESKILALTP